MKPESQRALLELYSFGVEELSSQEAQSLLKQVDDCPECHGEWLLLSRTLTTLNQCGHCDSLSSDRASRMWLVCVEHAKHKHTIPLPGRRASSEHEADSANSSSTSSDASTSAGSYHAHSETTEPSRSSTTR